MIWNVLEKATTGLIYTSALAVLYIAFTLAQDGEYVLAGAVAYAGVVWFLIAPDK